MLFFGLGTHFGRAVSQSSMGDRLGHVVDVGDTGGVALLIEPADRHTFVPSLFSDGLSRER
jgi:hypothetical protein